LSTNPTEPDEAGGKVIPLRPAAVGGERGGEVVDAREVSYEVALDDEPEQMPREPVYADITSRDDTFMPIIPAGLRGWANIKKTVKRVAGRNAHRLAAHGVRLLPLYLPQVAFWAVVGVFRLAGRQLAWWWHPQLSSMFQHAADTNDTEQGVKLHDRVSAARRARFIVLVGEVVVLAVAVMVLLSGVVPWWARWVVFAAALPWLAHFGRPLRQIVKPAVITPRFRLLNMDIVARAYYAAKLGDPDKPGQQITFPPPGLGRDAYNQGSEVLVDLPHGRTFADVVKAKDAIASGLDVTEQQVYLSRDKTSTRRHRLFVADVDPLAIPAGRTPMLDCKPRDIWQPCLMGLDERGRKVCLELLWNSVLVGSQPRKGKTFTARLLALYAALDPWVKLTVADGKSGQGSPDWNDFALVAHRYIRGTAPSRDGDPIDRLRDALREILRHIDTVNGVLSKLPADVCPEGKLTRELARDPRYPQLRVWVLVIEEFQNYFETDDQDVNKEIAGMLARIQAVGPSAGVIILSSSQKPAGVGAGDVQRLFNRYRDNHAVRFALKCGNRLVSEAVLGGDAYAEGYDASALPVGLEYRGVGYLYGASDETPLVRTHLADREDSKKILTAARQHRERLFLLTGEAAGEDMARQARDVLADVRSVFYAGEARISWPELAARLAEQMPGHYAEITAEAISAQVRAFGVTAKSVKDRKHFDKGVGQGFDRAALDAAIGRRQIEANRSDG